MTTVSRRDVVFVTFPDSDSIPDPEMDNPHPAVVIQSDDMNNKLRSTVVVPISSGTADEPLREVFIPSHSEPVDNDSVAVLTQITTVAVEERIFDEGEDESAWKMGELSREKMNEIEDRLGYLFGVGY